MHRLLRMLSAIAILGLAVLLVGITLSYKEYGRNRLNRTRPDHRSMATALETYYLDHGSYPVVRPFREIPYFDEATMKQIEKAGAASLGCVEWGREGLDGLTTPVAYLRSVFTDPASPVLLLPFPYYTDGEGWMVWSAGPDGEYDIRDPAEVYDSSIHQPSAYLLAGGPWTYDPTNGAKSSGDVWRVKD